MIKRPRVKYSCIVTLLYHAFIWWGAHVQINFASFQVGLYYEQHLQIVVGALWMGWAIPILSGIICISWWNFRLFLKAESRGTFSRHIYSIFYAAIPARVFFHNFWIVL